MIDIQQNTMSTNNFPREEFINRSNKKRKRQSRPQRQVIIGNDVLISSLAILLLLSGNHLQRCDSFQFRHINNNHCSIGFSPANYNKKSPATINDLFPGPWRRKQHERFQNSGILSLSSRSVDGRGESSNSTDIIEADNLISNEALVQSSSTIPKAKEVSPANIEEARSLRARAEELRAEARAMELELLQRASKQQEEKNAVIDKIIATLFLPLQYQGPQLSPGDTELDTDPSPSNQSEAVATSIPDARVVADRLRKGKFSRQQIVSVVDRLYQQHHGSSDQEARQRVLSKFTPQLQNLDEETQQHLLDEMQEAGLSDTNEAKTSSKKRQYSERFQVLIQAAVLLDESIVSKTPLKETKKITKPAAIPAAQASSEAASFALPDPLLSPSSSPLPSFSKSNFSSSSSSFSFQETSFVTSGKVGKSIELRINQLQELRIMELKRKIIAETKRISAMSWSQRLSSNHSGRTNNGNSTSTPGDLSGETPSFIPLWVPPAFFPYIISLDQSTGSSSSSSDYKIATNSTTPVVPYAVIRNSSLEASELETLKNEVLLGSRFYMTSYEFAPGAALFRGNMRTSLGNVPSTVPSLENSKNRTLQNRIDNNTAMVFADIQERLEAAGLEDKVQLFVLPDPEEGLTEKSTKSSVGLRRPHINAAIPRKEEPVIMALPKKLTPDESKLKKSWIKKIGKGLSYPVAILSTLFYSLKAFALNPNFFDALVNRRDATVLYSCIPLALGFISVQLIHELAHYFVAKRRKIKIGFPIPLSTMFYSNLPFFGCITPLRSFPQNRAALVDFALSGPMVTLAASLCMVFAGVLLTGSASAVQIARYPFMSVHTMKSNFLLGSILSWLLPKTMMLPLAQPIPMHPLFVIGRFGMISSALNLLPIFRLDGGRACFAALGQRQGAVISAFTILWVISNFFMSSSMLLVWTLLVAMFQMRVEIPCRDECTEVGRKREWLWLISFILSVSILLPFPQQGSFL